VRALLFALVVVGGLAVAAWGSDAAPTASPRLAAVVRGLSAPVLVTQAPGEPGRVYVVEQGGLIRVVERGRARPRPFLDVRSLVVAGGEQGLLGLAFSPGYARNRTFYVNYTARGDGSTRVVRYRAANGRALPGSAREILPTFVIGEGAPNGTSSPNGVPDAAERGAEPSAADLPAASTGREKK